MEISTPGRICLFGEHQDYLGLPIIAMAISLRSHIKGQKSTNQNIIIRKSDLDDVESFSLNDLKYDHSRDYYKSAFKICLSEGLQFSYGLNCEVSSDIPIQAGTSSSSAIMVSWIHFLSKMADNPPDWNREIIAKLAYQAEVLEFNEPGGMMDQYTTAIGGCIYLDQQPFSVKQLQPKLKTFVLGNSNQPKDTMAILKRCRDQRISIMEKLNTIYPDVSFNNCSDEHGKSILNHEEQALLEGTIENREILFQGMKELQKNEIDHNRIGQLLSDHHAVLRDKLKVSTEKIDNMIEASINAGALGAKVNGSGGGGCMFAYAPNNSNDIANAIENAGGTAHIIHADDGTRID